MGDIKRWRGLKDLVRDAVVHGTTAVEKVHLQTAQRPFAVLKQVPPLARPTDDIKRVHDVLVTASYGSVRAVTTAVGKVADLAFDAVEARGEQAADEQRAQNPGDSDESFPGEPPATAETD